ncbi:VWA-like domain-containing protein [Blautia schinkii]|nr:VWA-like domain-containing protein [Blautia schinkii]
MAGDELYNRQAELGIRILHNCRNELYGYFPYLDGAFASVTGCASRETGRMGTEGNFFYFSPEYLLRAYAENPWAVCRGYLHMLLHCVYLHLFRESEYEERWWNLACDIAVELVIERENVGRLALDANSVSIPASSSESSPVSSCELNSVREECFQRMAGNTGSAEMIYSMLKKDVFPYSMEEMEAAFVFDDHSFWKRSHEQGKAAKTKQKWERILAYTGQNKQEQKQRAGTKKGAVQEAAGKLGKSKYDYRKFLKQFAAPREEVELDSESFDYIFYNYGMEHYGNMPLIEPLEYKEVNKLEELVIAIDTSGSCSTETVRQFLSETYEILSAKENFFKKMKVFLIQCDCYVQDVMVIRSEEEWKACSKNIKIQGRGGTDFRPVFRYIQELKEKKELRRLKALIYFTDGDGIYPRCKPDYETAFVFLKESAKMDLVPPWGIRLLTG